MLLVHLLVAHEDSRYAARRSRDEARVRAEGLLARAQAGEDLAALAGDFSDEPSGRRGAGAMTVPAGIDGPFGSVAEVPVGGAELRESAYGFHVIERRA